MPSHHREQTASTVAFARCWLRPSTGEGRKLELSEDCTMGRHDQNINPSAVMVNCLAYTLRAGDTDFQGTLFWTQGGSHRCFQHDSSME